MSGNFLLDKLLINQRQQLVGCQEIGLLDLSENPCDFAHGGQNTGANAMSPSPNGKAVELRSVKPGLFLSSNFQPRKIHCSICQ